MPGKQWDEEEESSSGSEGSSSPQPGAIRRGKFDDEEAEDSDVLESWDAEDSEVEREKAKQAAAAKAQAEAEAAAAKKSKTQRIAEHKADRVQRATAAAAAAAAGEDESSEDETEPQRRDRLRRTEAEADLRNAQDLFGEVGSLPSGRSGPTTTVVLDAGDPSKTVDLASLPLLNPTTKAQFEAMREALVPILAASAKKAHYTLFLLEFAKQLCRELPADQIKKVASALTALSNEKMKEEKAAEKGGKKSRAQKTKTTLAINRPNVADTNVYDDAFGDDDFM